MGAEVGYLQWIQIQYGTHMHRGAPLAYSVGTGYYYDRITTVYEIRGKVDPRCRLPGSYTVSLWSLESQKGPGTWHTRSKEAEDVS